jgi:transcriptional regulator with XRE-family HTH domain
LAGYRKKTQLFDGWLAGNKLQSPHFLFIMTRSVAEFCREQSIDVAELSNRSGLDESRVTAIALGRWTPSPLERQKIATVFEVAVDQIAWGHVTPIQHLYGHGPG